MHYTIIKWLLLYSLNILVNLVNSMLFMPAPMALTLSSINETPKLIDKELDYEPYAIIFFSGYRPGSAFDSVDVFARTTNTHLTMKVQPIPDSLRFRDPTGVYINGTAYKGLFGNAPIAKISFRYPKKDEKAIEKYYTKFMDHEKAHRTCIFFSCNLPIFLF